MKNQSINVHIDKMVLHGFENLQPGQLQQSVQKELTRLLRDQGLHRSLYQSGDIKKITPKPIGLQASIKEKGLGHKIASSVYRGLKR